jgi:hypothetical protein
VENSGVIDVKRIIPAFLSYVPADALTDSPCLCHVSQKTERKCYQDYYTVDNLKKSYDRTCVYFIVAGAVRVKSIADPTGGLISIVIF